MSDAFSIGVFLYSDRFLGIFEEYLRQNAENWWGEHGVSPSNRGAFGDAIQKLSEHMLTKLFAANIGSSTLESVDMSLRDESVFFAILTRKDGMLDRSAA